MRCSDCCECEVALDDAPRPVVRPAVEAVAQAVEEQPVEDGGVSDDAPGAEQDPAL